jgi:hypothetical protein
VQGAATMRSSAVVVGSGSAVLVGSTVVASVGPSVMSIASALYQCGRQSALEGERIRCPGSMWPVCGHPAGGQCPAVSVATRHWIAGLCRSPGHREGVSVAVWANSQYHHRASGARQCGRPLRPKQGLLVEPGGGPAGQAVAPRGSPRSTRMPPGVVSGARPGASTISLAAAGAGRPNAWLRGERRIAGTDHGEGLLPVPRRSFERTGRNPGPVRCRLRPEQPTQLNRSR